MCSASEGAVPLLLALALAGVVAVGEAAGEQLDGADSTEAAADEVGYTSAPPLVTIARVEAWALQMVTQLETYESRVLDRQRLAEALGEVPPAGSRPRDGAALVRESAARMEALVRSRAAAAVEIARAAERLAASAAESPTADVQPSPDTTFLPSKELNRYKSWKEEDADNDQWRRNHSCRSYRPLHLERSYHFSANVTRRSSSVHVPVEVFDCADKVLSEVKRSEALDAEFRKNYANDASFSWQYFCSARGFLRHYPGAAWESMAGAARDGEPDLYDCRLRSWYVEAQGAPRDVLVVLDATGSITELKKLIAYELTRELLTALTDDDHVNVLRFNRQLLSPIPCFQDTLVPANHVNVAAMLENLRGFKTANDTSVPDVLLRAVQLLNASHARATSPPACQQALVLIADDVPENYSALMRELDPEGRVRVFVFLLGRGMMQTRHAEHLACSTDGLFAQISKPTDIAAQVRRLLRVLERPPVLHRQRHRASAAAAVWTDLYAHVQDPRWAQQRWRVKEKAEQKSRYQRLRRNKTAFLLPEQRNRDYMNNQYTTSLGHYSEEDAVPYQLMLSVAVPAFDPLQRENVTILLMEEKQRNSTREWPVARLLGVAGVDLPLSDLRLRLPYHKLGPGGALFLLDHRGNAVLHDDLRHVVEGDVLKPGYRTVDLLDVELSDDDLDSRTYSPALAQFREAIMRHDSGSTVLPALHPYDGRRRVVVGPRSYHWRRVRGTGYAVVVSLPADSGSGAADALAEFASPAGLGRRLTPELAQVAHRALNETDFAVQPDWLYCRYLEPGFGRAEEMLHFLRRVADEPTFAFERLAHRIRPLPPGLLERPHICDEELMARLAWEANATAWFAGEEEPNGGLEEEAVQCVFGTSTVFVATAGGLTRWRHRTVAGDGPAALPPVEEWQARAAAEPWYRRAAAAGERTLVLHLPTARGGPRGWITAARPLRHLAVTGFHFRADHLSALLAGITAPLCEAGEECEPSCASEEWRCVLVDEAGWVVAESSERAAPPHPETARPAPPHPETARPAPPHLAAAHPHVMRQLLSARVFHKRWLYDYQGACFPPKRGDPDAAPRASPTAARAFHWLLEAGRCVLLCARDSLQALFLLISVLGAHAETEVEEQKRKVRVRKDFDRLKWEKLYDSRVRVNETSPATCDRRRALYSLHSDADKALAHQATGCGNWSLVAARVPRTNLLLLAIYTLCADASAPPDPPPANPLHNLEVEPPGERHERPSSRLACWRHRTPRLTARAPVTLCHKHSPDQEVGYRQCWPPVPDPEPGSRAPRLASLPLRLCCRRCARAPIIVILYIYTCIFL